MQKEKYRDLEQKINDYFLYCDAVNEASEKLIKPYTLSGLLGYIEITRAEFERLSKSYLLNKCIIKINTPRCVASEVCLP